MMPYSVAAASPTPRPAGLGHRRREVQAMRLVIDTLIALMVVALVGGVLWTVQSGERAEADVLAVRDSLGQLTEQAKYQGALGHISNSPAGYPVHMMPEWFGETLPVNVLLPSDHPWIDLAPPGDTGFHPPDPVAQDETQAGFWYNPNTGVFRARVPAAPTRQAEQALYQQLNGTAIEIAELAADPERTPQTYRPVDATTAHATGRFLETYYGGRRLAPDAAAAGHDAEAAEVMVIDIVVGEASDPPTIHAERDRWTLPEPTESDAEAEAAATTPARGAEADRGDREEPAAEPPPRRKSLSELLRGAE